MYYDQNETAQGASSRQEADNLQVGDKEWFQKAAEQGDPDAQFNLGLCYEFGKGGEQDLDKAEEWVQKAAEQGYDRAKEWLEQL